MGLFCFTLVCSFFRLISLLLALTCSATSDRLEAFEKKLSL